MKIIVIDNINWKEAENDFAFHYNEIEAFIVYPGFHIKEVINEACSQYINQDVCYLINVHCVFATENKIEEATLLQEQTGVDFYRHLLKLYSDYDKELKVAFFSPIIKDKLLSDSQHPENAIISFYPFIEIPAEWKTFTDIIFNVTSWAKFNNASENFLAGWALNERQPINCNGKKVIFIDDQNEQWKTSFEHIFPANSEGKREIEVLPYNKAADPQREFSISKLDAGFKSKVEKADLIVSDFYLEEDHQDNYWMNRKELLQTSGFKLYNEIKKVNKGVPVVMHTLSNKISYYKVFDSYGIDNWFIKDIRANASRHERKENFLSLKNSIEEILSKDYYKELAFYWTKILDVERRSDLWWLESSNATEQAERKRNGDIFELTLADAETKKIIVQILKSSWFALRRLLNREDVFENIADENHDLINDHFTANSICSNLNKVFELLDIESGGKSKRLSILVTFLKQVRNSSSHSEYNILTIDDAIIYLDYLLFGLLSGARISNLQSAFPGKDDFLKTSFDDNLKTAFSYQLFWLYFQFNDRPCSNNSYLQKAKLKRRTKELYSIVSSTNLFTSVVTELGIRAINKEAEINIKKANGEVVEPREENLLRSYQKFHTQFKEIEVRLNASK